MKFKLNHGNYEHYENNIYYMNKFPNGFYSTIEGFIMRYMNNVNDLKIVCGFASEQIPCSSTSNWGFNFIKEDLSNFLRVLEKSKFYKMMDFISIFAERYLDDEGIEELNEILDESNIGYILEIDYFSRECVWIVRDNVEIDKKSVIETLDELDDRFKQTIEHLEQSLVQLKESNNDRARKDAVRDCMSAMESILKVLSDENDIKDASNSLFNSQKWGPRAIVKDGSSIWSQIHQMYPDIRHGQSQTSDITQEEALYWIDRMMAFVKYLSRRYEYLK